MALLFNKDDAISSRAFVFVPIFVLTAIFGGFAAVVMIGAPGPFGSPVVVLGLGAVTYSLAVGMLGRTGMSAIDRLEKLGMTDSLSGLPNRRALHIDTQHDAKNGDEVAMALIDLDGFKLVNDHFGHFVGDRVIVECSVILRDVCGTEARCYRLGGDEFALTMIGPVAGTILEGICRTFLERLYKPIRIDDRDIAIGASIGLARSAGADDLGSSELLRRSDVAMYASKSGGKMRCTWFKEDFDSSRAALREMDGELRHALAHDELRLLFQPLVDANSREVVAVEALLRWDRPDGTFIGPDVFIPVAEESGLINAIGLWVLRQSCREAMAWNDIKLSVNISAAQLRNPEFPILLGQILEETGFPAERLELEITETSLVLDPVIAERCLDVIRGFGISVVLDDFGTGYASIGFLRQFRFHKLKLDRSLIVDSARDESSLAMMLSSISMARAMKMNVTAEGVETQGQADMVRAAGCDQIQGWLYFKALPPGEIAQHLGAPLPEPVIAELLPTPIPTNRIAT